MHDSYWIPRLVYSLVSAAVIGAAITMAGCGSSVATSTSPSALSKCTVGFDTPAPTLPAAGGTGSIAVKTERECQWTAQPEVAWLSITANSSGQGDGAVQFNAAANGDPVSRTGGIVVNGQHAQVAQAAGECGFELGSKAGSFPQAGATGTVDVRASSALCTWTADADADWIAITANRNGKGSAAVAFTVAATSGPPRTATLTIAGLHFSVTQSEGCTYVIAPSAFATGASGGSSSVAVTGGAGCPWTASSDVSWITIASPTGVGSGAAAFAVAPTSGPARTGLLTIAGHVFTVTQSPGCTFEVSPTSQTVDRSGGTRTIEVRAAQGCAWTAASHDAWITVAAGAAGNGSGTVTVAAAATSGPSRSGTVTVAGQTVTIVQGDGCAFAISPDVQSVPASGGSGTVSVSAGAGCPWTAASRASWITITSGASGSGSGSVGFRADATTGAGRSGTVTIAGRTFTVNQGEGCTFSLSAAAAAAPADGGTGAFDVQTAASCGWAAASNASWLTVTAGATGNGGGTVRYAAAANTGAQRTGTITAAGQTFTVTQAAGCSYALSPASRNIGGAGGTASVTVTAAAGCGWTASSNASWIGISAGNSGSGNGTVDLVVAANADADRQGTVTIAGQTFTIVQSSGCSYTISPSSQTVPASGGTGSFNVTAGGGCAWTATAGAAWISVTSGAGGTGPGTVQFTAAANTGSGRSASITAGGQTFTVNQESGCSATVTPETMTAAAAGGSQTVSITTAPDCAWSATSQAPWIAVPNGAAGSGPGAVQLDVQPNMGPTRSGTATVAGKTVTVDQASGCTFSIAPSAQQIPVGGGSGSVTVTTAAGCTWTAVSNAAWITVRSGASGTGGGSVQLTIDANATGATRTGAIAIADQVFQVTQSGS